MRLPKSQTRKIRMFPKSVLKTEFSQNINESSTLRGGEVVIRIYCVLYYCILDGCMRILVDRGFAEFDDTTVDGLKSWSPTMNQGKRVLTTEESHHSRRNTLFRNSGESFNGR